MGLFSNSKKHPDLYTKEPVRAPNQSYWRANFLSKLLKQQQASTYQVQTALKQLQHMQKKHHLQQTTRWTEVQRQYTNLQKNLLENEKAFRKITEQVQKLHDNTALRDDITAQQSALLKQMEQIENHNELIFARLARYEKDYQELIERLEELENMQQETMTKIAGQTERQQRIATELENHSALLDKIMRQVEYIREIIFERSHFLATKMERGIQHVMHFFTKPGNTPSTLLEKEKEKIQS